MQKAELISIIVPVYKAEPYLAECVDSILASTYPNFELILVDDGSPDNCPKICDEYAKKDNRVKVVHKKNGGVSSARNAGLDIASGNYIGFVDSDDRILPEMYERMIAAMEEERADIVCCGIRFLDYDTGPLIAHPKEKQILDGVDCFEWLFSPDGCGDYYMNKLFCKHLFDGFCLPEGRAFEDVYSMHLLFEKSKKTVFLPEGLYEYRKLPDSLSHSATWSPRVLAYPDACREQYLFIKEKYPRFAPLAAQKYASAVLRVASDAVLQHAPNRRKLLFGFRNDLHALGEDLSSCDELIKAESSRLQKSVVAYARHCRALGFYDSLHNHPRLQALLKPFVNP